MRSHVPEDPGKRADSETRVIGNRYVVLAAVLSREPQVTTSLAGDLIAVAP